MELAKAKRQKAKMRLGLQGPSGSGKTYSALQIARGLTHSWNNIAIIDTEANSSHLYSELGDFYVLSLQKPYTPERYIEALRMCIDSGAAVVIVDSISHEWEGEGGILDIHSSMVGNSFTNWSKITPRHNKLLSEFLQANCDIIVTIRTKTDYVLSEKNGKMIPEKIGLKGITKDGLDYELTLVLDLDIAHMAHASKDRTGLFVKSPPFIPNQKTGERIKRWCQQGMGRTQVLRLLEAANTEHEVKKVYHDSGNFKIELKKEFKEKWNQVVLKNQSKNGTDIK
jgi:hypothetical protein